MPAESTSPRVGSKWRDRRRTRRVVEVVATSTNGRGKAIVSYKTVEPRPRARLVITDDPRIHSRYVQRFCWAFDLVPEGESDAE